MLKLLPGNTYIELTFTFALKLGMMDGFGTSEKDKEVCVVYQDDDQKVQINYQRICRITYNTCARQY